MQNSSPENIQEHSHRVALFAHALATISRLKFGRERDGERAAFLALLHDASEVITGDMPTPVKYHDAGARRAFKEIERAANRRLLEFLPPEFREAYGPALVPREEDGDCWRLVKAADKLCAWLKCVEERRAGNRDFLLAEEALARQLDGMAVDMPEVEYFRRHFAPGFSLTLDELGGGRSEDGADFC